MACDVDCNIRVIVAISQFPAKSAVNY